MLKLRQQSPIKPQAMSVSLGILMPLPLNGMGVGYTCGSLAKGMVSDDFNVTIITPRTRWSLPSVEVVEVLPEWARYIPYRWVRRRAARTLEHMFLACVDRFQSQKSVAYLWPEASVSAIQRLKRSGVTVFREQFNCHTGTAKRILDQAYDRFGVEPAHGITDEKIAGEREILEAVDRIFCPGPLVETSLLENGVPESKLLQTSYGWDPARLSGSHRLLSGRSGTTAIFVGAICVRKGAHLLLNYWAESGIKGRLVLAGEMEPVIKEKCASILARDDVIVLDYFKDVGALYRSADMFVFPSLEEGSPLVIYEACGSGLPVITTAMGAGRIARHGREAFVLDPYDGPAWVEALRRLADDVELRRGMADAAVQRAKQFVWAAPAAQRREQIINCLGHGV